MMQQQIAQGFGMPAMPQAPPKQNSPTNSLNSINTNQHNMLNSKPVPSMAAALTANATPPANEGGAPEQNFFNPGKPNLDMNATNNASGFAVEETKTNKPSTAAGVKSNVNPETLAK